MNKPHSSKITRIFRICRMVIHTLYGLFTASVILPRVSAERRDQIISRWCKALLDILNIRLVTSGQLPDQTVRGTMFVANHISWIDIHAINSVRTVRFVAKSDIREWPVFGWLVEKVNTLFTERHRRHDAGRMVELAAGCLRNGDCLCFFPEGTTTDGTELKPFKGSLLQAAINAEAQVWPIAIHYPNADGSANTAMSYAGDTSLLQSIKQILALRSPVAELHFMPPIPAAGYERRSLSALARQEILGGLDFPH